MGLRFSRFRPRLVIVLAAFAVCAGLALFFTAETLAATYFNTYRFGSESNRGTVGPPNLLDSNGRVPEYYAACVYGCNDRIIGNAKTMRRNATVYRWIYYDRPTMCRMRADQADWNRLFRHEHAHTRGWSHGEGNPTANSAYYPTIGGVRGGPPC